jgi:hypothetical protein
VNGHQFRKLTGISARDVLVRCVNEETTHDQYSVEVIVHDRRADRLVDYGTVTVVGHDNLSDRYGEARRLAYILITNERKQ